MLNMTWPLKNDECDSITGIKFVSTSWQFAGKPWGQLNAKSVTNNDVKKAWAKKQNIKIHIVRINQTFAPKKSM